MWMRMSSIFRLAVPVLVAVTAAACGSTTSPTPIVTQPPRPSKANIVVTAANATVGGSPRGGFNYRLEFDLSARETAGLGAKFNFLRCDFRDRNGNNIERQEAGSNQLNRIEANASLSQRITVDFNDSRADTVLVTLNATDDNGNVLEVQFTIQ